MHIIFFLLFVFAASLAAISVETPGASEQLSIVSFFAFCLFIVSWGEHIEKKAAIEREAFVERAKEQTQERIVQNLHVAKTEKPGAPYVHKNHAGHIDLIDWGEL